jgi:glycosyltransferase involved in cell wall biosynthesis
MPRDAAESGRSEPVAVTFFLFAYRQEATVREACEAALAQDYPGLEIVFSDDCSPDRTFEIMGEVARAYAGPHRVRLNRNDRNLGLIGHVNRSFELASGALIVAAAGDDLSAPDRVSALVEAYRASGGLANSIHSAVEAMDVAGRPLGLSRPPLLDLPDDVDAWALRVSLMIGASHAWTRRTQEVFGPITHAEAYEDLVIGVRSRLLGPVAYVDRPLVRYRVGEGLSTRRHGFLSRAQRLRGARVAHATFCQRRADYATIGRAVPPALDRAIAGEALKKELLSATATRVVALLARPRVAWFTLRWIATDLATAVRSRLRRRARRAAATAP